MWLVLVHVKTGVGQLNKGHGLIFGLFSDYERGSRPRQLNSVVPISLSCGNPWYLIIW